MEVMMKLLKVSVIILGLVSAASALTVYAVTPDPSDQNVYQREFKRLDADGNERLNATEAKKDSVFDHNGFSAADKNHNGSLTQDEFATYKSAVQQKEAKQLASDGAITSKIKAKFLLEKGIKSFKVSVEAKDGIVVLSGFVDSVEAKSRAEKIATSVTGVKSVKSALVVKP
jgi:hyperosmotically inducible periplasmic protein